jgi:hypothetical protein
MVTTTGSTPPDPSPRASLQQLGRLVLEHIHFASVHEPQYCSEMLEGDILQDDDGMLGRILLQQCLEVGEQAEDHLVGLGALPVTGDGHVCEGFLILEVFEADHHVSL